MDIIAENKVRETKEYRRLEEEITAFKRIAWGLVVVGGFALAAGLGALLSGQHSWIQAAGDFSGGLVASFWSLAGIMFVYIAFLGQRQQLMLQEEELRLSRKELAATRKELKGQKVQLQEQSKTAALQRFENTYFTLVKNLMDRLSNLRIKKTNTTGQAVYNNLRSGLIELYNKNKERKDPSEGFRIRDAVDKVQHRISREVIADDPILLFNEIYLIITFIKESALTKREKSFYFDLLFSKFSTPIVCVLLYHSFAEDYSEHRAYIVYFTNEGIDYPLSRFLIDSSHRELFKLSSEELDYFKF
ncbi:MAG: hypothetical protein AAFY76_26505 [Cyanobacteria bacterium J06649_11]